MTREVLKLAAASTINEPMLALMHRLHAGKENAPRIIAFISARPGEGVTTIATEYTNAIASIIEQKVLIINASMHKSHEVDRSSGIADAIIAGKPFKENIHSTHNNISTAKWSSSSQNRNMASQIIHNPGLWGNLLEMFDTVIIDTPSLHYSFDGVALAAKADATVIVVEAETTPKAVVKNLRELLLAAGATIAGVVMNKRHYYIPQKRYKRL